MAGRLIITAVTTITVARSITMGAIRTEAIQCGRTSPPQSRHTLRHRCGRQGITVIRTRPNSYYGSGYGYAGSTVAAVQQRLGQLGYYRGVVDGAIGPRTRSAIAAFESRHGLIVDGRISRPLLNRLGLA
ncbi:MAG: hypothetical protein DMF31_07425 [Verrucomicrobia bacterium]|nr:MAG: hypothetical protein DMF31_07425 [Verrucomicrobiota bacterium]